MQQQSITCLFVYIENKPAITAYSTNVCESVYLIRTRASYCYLIIFIIVFMCRQRQPQHTTSNTHILMLCSHANTHSLAHNLAFPKIRCQQPSSSRYGATLGRDANWHDSLCIVAANEHKPVLPS